jgi:porin
VLMTCCSLARADVRNPFTDLALEWGGLRSYLRERGVDVRIGYVSETVTNVQGGEKELWRYADQWTFATALDLEKLLGWDRAQFKITITDRNGSNLSADAHLGSLQEVQEIYGRGQTWHWTQFSYDQQYLEGRLDWKIGRLVGGEDFADFSCEFINLALCGPPPGNMAVNYWYNWPVSQWATRLKASFKGFGYVQAGIYEADPDYLLTRHGLNLGDPGHATGVLVPVEVGWAPVFGEGLEGTYKFGGWYNSSRAPDAVDGRLHAGEYGEYINFLQRLTAPAGPASKRGLSVFLNSTFADRRTATLDNQTALGMIYVGPLPSREHDVVGIALGRTHVNPRIAGAEDLIGAQRQGSEWVGEIFYGVAIDKWLELRPDIQYIYQPGGIAHVTDDVIVGLRLSVSL